MFVDSKDKDVKHAFAVMFVEILLPVAASANRELNVPALKTFVDMMYHHSFDLTKKTRYSHVSSLANSAGLEANLWKHLSTGQVTFKLYSPAYCH